jgi:hypothetical protein
MVAPEETLLMQDILYRTRQEENRCERLNSLADRRNRQGEAKCEGRKRHGERGAKNAEGY